MLEDACTRINSLGYGDVWAGTRGVIIFNCCFLLLVDVLFNYVFRVWMDLCVKTAQGNVCTRSTPRWCTISALEVLLLLTAWYSTSSFTPRVIRHLQDC